MEKIENWSWGYALLKPYAQLIHRLAHREIIVTGTENIPKDKPVIFAPNHQNALMDAMVLVTTIPGQIVFLARADIFKNSRTAKALRFLKIMPVYRIRDGKDSLDKNDEIFNQTIRILSNNKQIGLFPEAQHVGMKSMISHKKAIPRIVFLAGERTNYSLDIQIIPVGIYYNHYWNFRRTLVVNYGKPIAVQPYYEQLKREGERNATIALRDRIYNELKKLIVHVQDKENYTRFAKLSNLFKPVTKVLSKRDKANEMVIEQETIKKLESTLNADTTIKEQSFESIDRIAKIQSKLNLSDKTIALGPINPAIAVLKFIGIAAMSPIILLAAITSGPIFWATRYPYRKGIKDPQFWSSISFGISLFAYPVWYLILLTVFGIILKNLLWAFIAVLLLIPIGILGWTLAQSFLSTMERLKFRLNLKNKDYSELQELRNSLINQFSTF